MAYTIPPGNTTNPVVMLQFMNSSTQTWAGIAIICAIWIIIFAALKRYDTLVSASVASFIVTILSYMFWILEVVPEVLPVLFTFITAMAIAFLYAKNARK